ncbi:Tripartite DNA replication factor [Chamberlinius hualienensis]
MKLSRKKSNRNQVDSSQRKILSYFQTSSVCQTKETLRSETRLSHSENKVVEPVFSEKHNVIEDDCIIVKEVTARSPELCRTPTHHFPLLSRVENVISPSPELKVKPSSKFLISNKRKFFQSPTSSKPATKLPSAGRRCNKRINNLELDNQSECKVDDSLIDGVIYLRSNEISKHQANNELKIQCGSTSAFSDISVESGCSFKNSEIPNISTSNELKLRECKYSEDVVMHKLEKNESKLKETTTLDDYELEIVPHVNHDEVFSDLDEPITNELENLHVEDQGNGNGEVNCEDGISSSQCSDELFFEKISNKNSDDILSGLLDENLPLFQKNGRHRVVHVAQGCSSVILSLQSIANQIERKCILKGFWCDTTVHVGDIVNVLAEFNADQTVTIDNYSGLLIVNPDILISGTTVVAAVFCQRKAIFSEWFREVDGGDYSRVVGNVIHELFQQCIVDIDELPTKQMTFEIFNQKLLHIMSKERNLLEMYRYKDKFSGNNALVECREFLDKILDWTNSYMGKKSVENGDKSNGIQVTKIHDIEETLWSPRLGLKGKIDVTAEVTLHSRGKSRLILPLELKTGKASFSSEHRGQVMLYSMLTSEKRENPNGGLLLYLKHSEMKEIKDDFKCQQGLIQMRNKIASSLAKPVIKTNSLSQSYSLNELPPVICSSRICKNCPYLTTCAIYQRLNSGFNEATTVKLSPDNIFTQSTSHLNDDDIKYFELWCSCLFLESMSDNDKGIDTKSIWCNSGDFRENRGLAYTKLCLVDYAGRPEGMHRFMRRSGVGFDNTKDSMNSMQYVLVSVEDPLEIAIGMGYVIEITNSYIGVKLDKDFYKRGQLEVSYRIDSSVSKSSWSTCMGNVARLMMNNDNCNRLRNIIVHRQLPTFKTQLPKSVVLAVKPVLRSLNKGQQAAIFKALLCNDFLLIKGMPGTGKTATIAALVEVLVKLGRSVLLASHTHSAVDNILCKLLDKKIDFLRLGNSSRVKAEIKPYTIEHFLKECQSVDELDNYAKSKMVVATTCLGSNHAIFSQRNSFDYCIVDEASQILQAACLGPLFNCKKFILVGDPNQLPPIIKNDVVKDMNVDSLFDRLDCSEALVELNSQYRMNGEIVRLANILSYRGLLKAASDDIFNSVLKLENIEDGLKMFHSDQISMLRNLSSPVLENSVLFINTDAIPIAEQSNGNKKLINQVECRIALFIVQFFMKVGLSENQIGIITPFRDQVTYLRSAVHNAVEVNTVDQYQGRDKDVIIISCVRDMVHDNMKGSILNDKRRVNVAITRARTKLIVYAINAGGDAHTDIHGIYYERDPLHGKDGTPSDYGRQLLIGRVAPADMILYQTERYHAKSFGYSIDIKDDGNYVLVLKFCEVYFKAPNMKVFDVNVNDINVISDLDIYNKVGRGIAHDEYVPLRIEKKKLTVGDDEIDFSGQLKVEFAKGPRDNPKVNAIYLMKGTIDDIPKLPPIESEEELFKEEPVPTKTSSSSSNNKHSRNPSGPRNPDPYTLDESSTMLPIFIALVAFIPILFCLCKL